MPCHFEITRMERYKASRIVAKLRAQRNVPTTAGILGISSFNVMAIERMTRRKTTAEGFWASAAAIRKVLDFGKAIDAVIR